MKVPKRVVFKHSVVLTSIAGGLLFLSACSSTKVLDNNGDIPAPSLNPPENANQVVNQELQTQSIISTPERPELIQTATNVPGFKEGIEGKVKYTVKKGDSLWKVAKMFDVSVRELSAYNHIETSAMLRVGAILQIPPSGLAVPRTIVASSNLPVKQKSKSDAKKSGTRVGGVSSYTVKKGDFLESIAKKHGMSVRHLLSANPSLTEQSKLKIGQKLNVPAKAQKTTKKAVANEAKAISTLETKPKDKPLHDLVSSSDVIDTSKPADTKAQQESTVTDTASSVVATPVTAATSEVPLATEVTEQKPVASVATPSYLPHTVKDGDTWQTIADMYGLSVGDLQKVNTSVSGEPKVGTTVNIPEE